VKADELGEKYCKPTSELCDAIYYDDFLAALREYGAAVRARDVGICNAYVGFFGYVPDADLTPLHKREREAYGACAAAISR